jgi:uncharacterized protein YdeI (YjbR/CyaY-like superfamily)
MGKMKTADDFFNSVQQWKEELIYLRSLLKETDLIETIKWGMPYYTIRNKNVVAIAGFKAHFGLWFTHGALLSDPHRILINAQEGKTMGMRHIKYSSRGEIIPDIVKSYVLEAIDNQVKNKVLKVEKRIVNTSMELMNALNQQPLLLSKFNNLTDGRQKDYHEYINLAKQAATKQSRIQKCLTIISKGQGLNDQYK